MTFNFDAYKEILLKIEEKIGHINDIDDTLAVDEFSKSLFIYVYFGFEKQRVLLPTTKVVELLKNEQDQLKPELRALAAELAKV